MLKASWAAGAALLALVAVGPASAQQTVKIGAVYPLSGNSASAGNYEKMAIEMGADLVNNGNADLAKVLPLAKGGGLSGLKGAKIQMVFADNQERRRPARTRPCASSPRKRSCRSSARISRASR